MRIEIKADGELSPAERAGLESLSAECFPPDADGVEWSDEGDWHVLVWEGDQIVSHVEIIERAVTVGGRPVRLGGIGGVATRSAWRRRGLAGAAMQAAQDHLRAELKVEFGLLVCGENMLPYYAKLGWKQVTAPTWIEQTKGRTLFKGPVMILPACRRDWPEGEIDLKGRPW